MSRGQNIVIAWRSEEVKADRAAGLAGELVRLKVDVMVVSGTGAKTPVSPSRSPCRFGRTRCFGSSGNFKTGRVGR